MAIDDITQSTSNLITTTAMIHHSPVNKDVKVDHHRQMTPFTASYLSPNDNSNQKRQGIIRFFKKLGSKKKNNRSPPTPIENLQKKRKEFATPSSASDISDKSVIQESPKISERPISGRTRSI